MEDRPPFVRVRNLTRSYVRRHESRAARRVQALAGVDLDIAAGAIVALVGESGSGKSTLARCLALLEPPGSGGIWIEGEDVLAASGPRRRALHERVQLIFQDTAGALDPRLTAEEIVREPLDILRRGGAREREERALSLMESVGLSREWRSRLPLDLSGGQRQRLAIARALAVEPRLLILDEAFTGLDASIQAQVAGLLLALRREKGLTLLLISHDLALMSVLADELAILYEGRIVEEGPASRLFADPRHPHTRALVAAVPSLPELRPGPDAANVP
jgi:ABC-type glutathione transport system ATPase component